MLRVIAGVQKLDRGACVNVLAQRQALLPQDPKGLFVCDTVHEELAEWQHSCGYADADVDAIAQAFGLAERLSNHPYDLSGGQQQPLALAKLLLTKPSLLLLDEPTTWLDISHQIDLLELLSELNREKGYTLAAVLHDLNQACRYASHLIALREGKIVAQGAPKEIVTAELIERIYGLRCMIIDDPVAGTPLVVPLGRTAPSTAKI